MSTTPQQPAPQVIIVKQKSNGCLFWAVAVLLFGWLGVIWFAAWKVLQIGWRLTWATVRVSWAATVKLCVWSYQVSRAAVIAATPYVVRASKAFHARYGVRGWAILGGSVAGVLVVVAIISAVTGR